MTGDFGLGMACCCIAAVGFGSNYLPVKKVDCGDGFFFAAMMAIGIGIVGIAVNYSELTAGPFFHSPRFEPYAMIGGAAWMLGNLMTPTIIRLVGLGIGLTIWDLSNMVMGWATGNFGLFGVREESVKTPWMNYLGLALAGVSLVLFAQAMEPEADEKVAERGDCDVAQSEKPGACEHGGAIHGEHEDFEIQTEAPVVDADTLQTEVAPTASSQRWSSDAGEQKPTSLPTSGTTLSNASTAVSLGSGDSEELAVDLECGGDTQEKQQNTSTSSKAGAMRRCFGSSARGAQALGFGMALVAGVLFGYTFDTATELQQDTGPEHSNSAMDYVLSHFCGIVAMGFVSLLVYVLVKGRRSYTPRELVMPSILSGMMWGVAQVAWFRANQELSIVVAFPIVSSLPGLVALAWGVLFFGELSSAKSRRFALAGLLVRLPSVVLIAISNLEL